MGPGSQDVETVGPSVFTVVSFLVLCLCVIYLQTWGCGAAGTWVGLCGGAGRAGEQLTLGWGLESVPWPPVQAKP